MPKTEKADPKRPKLRMDKEEPRCKKSSTEIDDPRRLKLRRESDDPKCR
jgi:hypothetical protein